MRSAPQTGPLVRERRFSSLSLAPRGVAAPLSWFYSARSGRRCKEGGGARDLGTAAGTRLRFAELAVSRSRRYNGGMRQETQHASLTLERWSALSLDRQILSIASEMNRAGKLFAPQDRGRLRNAYQRVLRLADLTVEARLAWSLRSQLLRWRERAGIVHLEPDEAQHLELLREPLLMTPDSAKQLPFLMAEPRR